MKVPFLDLSIQHKKVMPEINRAMKKTAQRGDFILGAALNEFEKNFAKYCNSKFAIGVNSGTDALYLSLLSLGIGKDDEVIIPAFTYIATALAVTYTQAKPVFVDIDPNTYNIDPSKIEKAITKKTKAIIPVHLYGQPAEMNAILRIANKYNLKVIEDAAQAHGAKQKISKNKWQTSGSFGDLGCFSFYPTKNLGAFGDGGAIVTNDLTLYQRLVKLRDYGRKSKYEHATLGFNSRLDTLQAAIIGVKLKYLNTWNSLRAKSAAIYSNKLKNLPGVITPYTTYNNKHVYNVYALRLKKRDQIVNKLSKNGVGVIIHYPIPLHLQEVYKGLGYRKGDFPIAEEIAQEIVSLPIFPYLKTKQIDYITNIIKTNL